jgi:hypothetical protein
MCSDDCCDCCSCCDDDDDDDDDSVECGLCCLICGKCCLISLECLVCLGGIAVAVGSKGGQVRTEKATEVNTQQPIKIITI